MKDFRVTITDPVRAAEWQEILGTTTVCVRSPIPTLGELPGHPKALIYELDLNMLTPEQFENIVVFISKKFNEPVEAVRAGILILGMPILADDCMVIVENPQRWLS